VTPFYVLGALLAAWALVVTALGVSREDFPPKGAGEKVVAAISVVLVAAAISSAIITSANEEEAEGGEPAKEAGKAPAQTRQAGKAPAQAPQAGGEQLELSADPTGQLKFDKDSLQAKAGEVTITLSNPSPVPHNVSLEGGGVDEEGKTVGKGGTSTISADLKPGNYTFYCSVPGHRQAGMEGTLTVH
jgi:plastocyanin